LLFFFKNKEKEKEKEEEVIHSFIYFFKSKIYLTYWIKKLLTMWIYILNLSS